MHIINDGTHAPRGMMVNATLPNVLLIGVQKAATSSISKLLFDNGICYGQGGLTKAEIHYFDHSEKFRKGKEYYIERSGTATRKNTVWG